MDFSSTIIGIILVAFCALPVVLLAISQRRKHRKLLQRFLAQAKAHSLQISECEVWRNRVIGIDTAKKQVLYMDLGHAGNFVQLIDLNYIGQCKIHELNKGDERGMRFLDRLTLELVDKRAGKAPDSIEFYNSEREFRVDRDHTRIQRWAVTINKCLMSNEGFFAKNSNYLPFI